MLSGTHANPVDYTIANDGFFPDINIKDFQEIMRIKADLAESLMLKRLQRAIFHINKELADFKTDQVEAGILKLEDVEQSSLGAGEPLQQELLLYYESAVFNFALGELHPELVSLSRRKEASDYMETIKENRQDYYNDALDSIRLILGHKKSKACAGLFSTVLQDEN